MAGNTSPDSKELSPHSSPLRALVTYYKDTATLHGVAQVGGQRLYGFRRCLWLVLMLFMAVGLTLLMCVHLIRYIHYPFITVVNAYTASTLPFPAVTICNLNQFHRDRIPNDPRLQKLLYLLSEVANVQDYLTPVDEHLENGTSKVLVESGEELENFALNAAQTMKEMFRYCVWKGQNRSCEELFSVTVTDLGVCYTFNAHDSKLRLTSSDPGRLAGLSVILDIQQDYYYYSMLTQSGIKVLLHEPSEPPLLTSRGFFVRPGTCTDVSMRKEQRISLAYPYKAFGDGYCLDTHDPDFRSSLTRYRNYDYSEPACWRECFVKRLVGICGCRHFYDPGNDKVCSIDVLEKCYIPSAGSIFRKWIANISLEDVQNCGCNTPCSEVTYSFSLSFTDFASRFIIHHLFQTGAVPDKDYVRENLIDLRVYFGTMTVLETMQQPEMTVMSIFGTMGGHMGLCLGASILSVTELVELVVLLVISSCMKRWGNVKPDSLTASTTTEAEHIERRDSMKELTDSVF